MFAVNYYFTGTLCSVENTLKTVNVVSAEGGGVTQTLMCRNSNCR